MEPQSQSRKPHILGPLRMAGWAGDCKSTRGEFRAHYRGRLRSPRRGPGFGSQQGISSLEGRLLEGKSDRRPSSDLLGLMFHFPHRSLFHHQARAHLFEFPPVLEDYSVLPPLVASHPAIHPSTPPSPLGGKKERKKLVALSVLNLGHGIGCFSTRRARHDRRQSQTVESSCASDRAPDQQASSNW